MGYAPLPVPPAYAGPSGEPGQILLHGITTKVSVFHGRIDDEADWHVFIRPDRSDWPIEMYCEIMVLDDFSKPLIGDDKFFSADFTLPLRLSKPGSEHPAWDLGKEAIDEQGSSLDCSAFSRLVTERGRVYLQGAYVNDEAHDTQVEIHPLDSIAFAMDQSGRTLSARPGEAGWPTDVVRWRMAVFANSGLHRINDESFLKRRRTTAWFLDPPDPPAKGPLDGTVPLPTTLEFEERPMRLWNGDREEFYDSRLVDAIVPPQLTDDPRGGGQKLRVGARMQEPDDHGGMVVRDYVIRRVKKPDVVKP